MIDRYILDALGEPVPEPDLLKWARWLETADRTVARDELPDGRVVSTVFLSLDHSWSDEPTHKPVLWETALFDRDGHVADMWRYDSKQAAIDGHARVLTMTVHNMRVAK